MDFTATLALIIFTLFLVAFVGGQLYLERKRQREYERAKAERMHYLAPSYEDVQPADLTPTERAIVRTEVVKLQKRRARQRKAARRSK